MTASTESSLRNEGQPASTPPAEGVAFEQMVERFRPYLRRVAAQLLQDQLPGKTDPSDVVQRSLMAAFENFAQWRGQDDKAWRAWLVQIVRNEVLNLVRYYHQERRNVAREQPLPAGSAEGHPPAADGSSPSEQVLRRERAAYVMATLEQLAPDHRQVIELRHLENLSFPEIAQRMQRSHDAVRQLWERAIQKFSQAWRTAYEGRAEPSSH